MHKVLHHLQSSVIRLAHKSAVDGHPESPQVGDSRSANREQRLNSDPLLCIIAHGLGLNRSEHFFIISLLPALLLSSVLHSFFCYVVVSAHYFVRVMSLRVMSDRLGSWSRFGLLI